MGQVSKMLGLLPGDEGPGARQVAVLECLRRTGPMTTMQLTDMMGACISTNVRWSCGRLQARDYIVAVDNESVPKKLREEMFARRCENGGGRPSTLYVITAAGLSCLRTLSSVG
jgi:predicted ArsR family transcriptional regulator